MQRQAAGRACFDQVALADQRLGAVQLDVRLVDEVTGLLAYLQAPGIDIQSFVPALLVDPQHAHIAVGEHRPMRRIFLIFQSQRLFVELPGLVQLAAYRRQHRQVVRHIPRFCGSALFQEGTRLLPAPFGFVVPTLLIIHRAPV